MAARIRTTRCSDNPVFGRARPTLGHGKRTELTKEKPMSKSAAFDLGYETPLDHLGRPTPAVVRPNGEALLLPGEAVDSLHRVHRVLQTELPAGELDVYEAGGGSTS